MPRPRTIRNLYGFPRELCDVRFRSPGLPELYDEIADVVHPTWDRSGHGHQEEERSVSFCLRSVTALPD